MSTTGLLVTLQLADSTLPIGRFAHSLGLESWLTAEPTADEGTIVETVESLLLESVAPLDGAAVALAHDAADDLPSLLRLDRAVSVRKLTAASRLASTSCGRNLAALVPLVWQAPAAAAFAACVTEGTADGNLAVLEGALTHDLGIHQRSAVLLELRGTVAALLTVPVRLGRLPVSRSQVALASLHGAIERAADVALATTLCEMRSFAPEFEIAAMTHRRRDARLFAT
jgi:urease accessory protein